MSSHGTAHTQSAEALALTLLESISSEILAWVRTRRAGKALTHHGEAPEPLHWPNAPKEALSMEGTVSGWRKRGRSYVHWERPALAAVDPKRRLLATGRYADQEAAAAAAQNAAGKELVGRKRPRRVTATKKRKKDGVGAGAPDSSVDASPPPKRRSSRRRTATCRP